MKRITTVLLILTLLFCGGCVADKEDSDQLPVKTPVSQSDTTPTEPTEPTVPSEPTEQADTPEPKPAGPGAGVEISCMSFNVLSYDTHEAGYAEPAKRAEAVLCFLREQNTDLVGLQEVTNAHGYDWVTKLKDGLSDIYECRALTDEEYCPISNMRIASGLMFLYRKDRFEYVASDCWDYAYDTGRYYHWVKLYDKKAKREVLFTNTHFSINSGDAENGNYKRCGEAEELLELWKTECKDLALFATGDYNSHSYDEPHENYLKSDIYLPSAEVGEDAVGYSGIDFCYVNPEATDVSLHLEMDRTYQYTDGSSVKMSDHPPILTRAIYK